MHSHHLPSIILGILAKSAGWRVLVSVQVVIQTECAHSLFFTPLLLYSSRHPERLNGNPANKTSEFSSKGANKKVFYTQTYLLSSWISSSSCCVSIEISTFLLFWCILTNPLPPLIHFPVWYVRAQPKLLLAKQANHTKPIRNLFHFINGATVRHRAPRRIRGSSYPTFAHEPLKKKTKQHSPPARMLWQ